MLHVKMCTGLLCTVLRQGCLKTSYNMLIVKLFAVQAYFHLRKRLCRIKTHVDTCEFGFTHHKRCRTNMANVAYTKV